MASETDEGNCRLCQEIETQRKKVDSQPHSFSFHVNLSIFQRKKKEDKASHQKRIAEKKKTIQELEKIVSALRNTLGGSVVVHLIGHQKTDLYLGHLDDFVGSRFRGLIQNGDLFVDTYTRRWIGEDFVLITVAKSENVSTADFNTKVNTDFENTNPTLCNIRSILKRKPSGEVIPPSIRGIGPDLQSLHESRCVQLKCYMPKDKVKQGEETYISQVINFIWDDLKFKHNLTSMSKIEGGGSFYVGIEEKDVTDTPYQCKVPNLTGFEFSDSDRDRTAFYECFLQKFQESATVLDLYGNFTDDVKSLDLIRLRFHDYHNVCVLEIAIRFFEGIIFYDKKGPRAYTIEHNRIERMGRSEWLQKINDSE